MKDGVNGYELGCALTLMQRGLASPAREDDLMMRLHRVLTEDLQEAAPNGAEQKGQNEADH